MAAGTPGIVLGMALANRSLADAVQRVAGELRSHDAVAVVGAGLSAGARLPLASTLDSLLYTALDADPKALATVQASLGINAGPKEVVDQASGRLSLVWDAIARSSSARGAFQTTFAALDADRQHSFSPAHDALAELIHRRQVDLVVSLNWDTKLEAAYFARYGQRIRADWLIKPHGDAADPDRRWVLPGEAVAMPSTLVEQLARMAAVRPRLLLIVGYSESDEYVVSELTAPLTSRWKVARLGPGATGDMSLNGSADEALPALRDAAAVGPEAAGWEYVRFDPPRDLTWALSGRGLGPRDVEICPAIDEVGRLVRDLAAGGAALITGPSGSGKSLAAYQAAHFFWRDGSEVVRLADPALPALQLREVLRGLPRPLIAVVDDGQRLRESDLRTLLDLGGDGLLIVAVVSSDSPVASLGIRIDAPRAAAALSVALERRRAETLAAVATLDPHVGDGYIDEPLEHRIEVAARDAKTPWHLSFVLSGGWRRLAGRVHELDGPAEADLLLAFVAATQLLTLDDDVAIEQLYTFAAAVNRPANWITEGLRGLRARQLLLDLDVARLPHRRFARGLFALMLSGPQRDRCLLGVRAAIRLHRGSLEGVYWLLLDLQDAARDAGIDSQVILDGELLEIVVARCEAAEHPRERGAAAHVLNQLSYAGHATPTHAQARMLGGWVSAGQPLSMRGLARLINDLSQRDPEAFEALCESVDAAALMSEFARCDWSDAYYFGHLLDRLATVAPQSLRRRLEGCLDRQAALRLFDRWPHAEGVELYDVDALAWGLANISHDVALEGLDRVADALARRWQANFVEGWADLHELQFVLGLPPSFLRGRAPSRRERAVARRIVEGLEPDVVAAQISASRQREWEPIGHAMELIATASPRHARRIADRVDLDELDASTAEFWPERSAVFRGLTVSLAQGEDNEPAAQWYARHVNDMKRIDDVAFRLVPQSSAERARDLGDVVHLQGIEIGSWGWLREVLCLLLATDRDLAASTLEKHQEQFASAFTRASYAERNELRPVLDLLADLDRDLLLGIVTRVDASKAEEVWARRLRGNERERRAISRLIDLALDCDGPVRDVAERLRRRFPSASTRR